MIDYNDNNYLKNKKMSAQQPPIGMSKCNKKQQQQKIKQKCYQILQSNHSTLWQNLIISILNHIDYSYKTTNNNINVNANKKSKINTQQGWLQQEIELILEWISNPSNRIKSIQYSMYVKKMEKEKKEWLFAIKKLLDEQSVLRERFEGQIQELRNRVREVQEFSETLKVKNSVQQQIILAMKNIEQNKSVRKNYINSIENQRMSIRSEINIQIRSMKDKVQEQFPKMQEKCTMTMQILSKMVETSQDSCLSKLIPNSSVFNIYLQPKLKRLSLQKIPYASCLSPKQSTTQTTQTVHNNNKISQTVCQTICQTTKACSSQPGAKKAELQRSSSQIKNRQTECTEQDEQSQLEQNQQQSSSQQSAYILQVDHGTQTSHVQMKQMQLQTDLKFILDEAKMGGLLKKISLLEIDIFNKDREILGKQQQIRDFVRKVQCMNRQILELKSDIQINQQIQEHLQSSYEKQKSQNLQLTQKYNQIFSTLSTYLSIKPLLIQQEIQTDPNETLALCFTPHKQQIYDDQLLTNQSEEEQHQLMKKKDIINEVDKETIIRQLLKYMEMEVQDVAFQKKASVFVTILMVLGIQGKEEDILAKYLAKVGGLNKKKRDCGLEDKLYHYFTDDV